MEDNQENSLLKKCSIIIHEDHTEADNIQPMMCPLCKSVLQLYQIHFDEKFLMCGNVDCAFPIGMTDYHIYKIECNEEVIRPDSSNSNGGSSITSGSMTSFTDWSDVERFVHTTPYSPASTPPRSLIEEPEDMEKLTKMKEAIQNEQLLRRNVKRIKELNKQLFEADEKLDMDNKNWIERIAQMQERSGIQVLKKHELTKIKHVVPKISASDLKIDVDTSQSIISLKIGIDDHKEEK